MDCVLHKCLGDYVPPSPRRNLPSLQPFILAVEAAKIRLLKKGILAFLLNYSERQTAEGSREKIDGSRFQYESESQELPGRLLYHQ